MSIEAELLRDQLVGKRLEEVENLCRESGVRYRVKRPDESFATTDYDDNRVSLTVRDGMVTRADIG